MGEEKDVSEANQPYIREVWDYNLELEMKKIREMVNSYSYLAMDTEFPGVILRPIGNFKSTFEYHYQTMRCNVNVLRIIQLGITFADSSGTLAPNPCTFQFNFKFRVGYDFFSRDSLHLLCNSGVDFKKHESIGVDPIKFSELLISSGLVLNHRIKWISFHGSYDIGYLIRLLTCQPLPSLEVEFVKIMSKYFPCVYDMKCMMRHLGFCKGGLQELADDLNVKRIGGPHQAGSDSLLTCMLFFAVCQKHFPDGIDDSLFKGNVYGMVPPNSITLVNPNNTFINNTSFGANFINYGGVMPENISNFNKPYNSKLVTNKIINQTSTNITNLSNVSGGQEISLPNVMNKNEGSNESNEIIKDSIKNVEDESNNNVIVSLYGSSTINNTSGLAGVNAKNQNISSPIIPKNNTILPLNNQSNHTTTTSSPNHFLNEGNQNLGMMVTSPSSVDYKNLISNISSGKNNLTVGSNNAVTVTRSPVKSSNLIITSPHLNDIKSGSNITVSLKSSNLLQNNSQGVQQSSNYSYLSSNNQDT